MRHPPESRVPPHLELLMPTPTFITIGPVATPFGELELITYEASFTVSQQRSSTGTSEPVATVTIRATDWNYTDAAPVVVP
jgi:hypothetical protein